jgi:inorganic pyrophosphatase
MTEPYTFDVLIQQPSADVYAYAYDESARTLRLDGAWRTSDDGFAERGVVVNAVTPRGEALRAWIVADLPIAPRTRVTARAVGALEFRRGELLEHVIVAVPTADSRYARAQAFNDLPAVHRAMLQRVLEESARWLDANSAEEIVHLARQRARLAQAEEHEHGRARPAWEADERSPIAQLARETTLHTQAEAALFTVPYRFQQHLRVCLRADERILFWVHRPRFTFSRIAGLGGKTVREGLLVLTDQQCLWLVDPVTPTVPVEGGYGYIARTVAVERIVNAMLTAKADHRVLEIVSTNGRGVGGTFRIEFPPAAHAELEQAVRLLNAFAPRANEQRLRRVFIPGAPRLYLDDPMDQDRQQTAARLAQLQTILTQQLNNEIICAQTFVPAWADGDLRLFTVTNRRVLMIAQRTPEKLITLAVQDILASEICYSVFASWLKLWTANSQPFQITFPLTSFAGFNACWRTTRELD